MSHLGTQKNALQLMKLSYYFLCIEDGLQENKFSEQASCMFYMIHLNFLALIQLFYFFANVDSIHKCSLHLFESSLLLTMCAWKRT